MIFHDCGHGSYFTTPAANRVMGVLIGWVIFQTANWSLGHAKHHQTSGQPENSLGCKGRSKQQERRPVWTHPCLTRVSTLGWGPSPYCLTIPHLARLWPRCHVG